MKLLLDTHVLLWWLTEPKILSQVAYAAIGDGNNFVYVSAAVIWEMVIKKSIGKLKMPDDIQQVMQLNNFNLLPVTVEHALAVDKLPDHHRDPFDRMLIAQSIHEGLTLVSRDPQAVQYPVAVMRG